MAKFLGIKGITKQKMPAQITPESVRVAPVKEANDPGGRFRGLKRMLADKRNGFKKMKI